MTFFTNFCKNKCKINIVLLSKNFIWKEFQLSPFPNFAWLVTVRGRKFLCFLLSSPLSVTLDLDIIQLNRRYDLLNVGIWVILFLFFLVYVPFDDVFTIVVHCRPKLKIVPGSREGYDMFTIKHLNKNFKESVYVWKHRNVFTDIQRI